MKYSIKLAYFLWLLALVTLVSCNRDSVEPTLDTFGIEDNDLIQVTNAQPFIPVRISASDNKGIDNIVVKVMKDGATEAVASNTLRQIINSDLNNFTVNVNVPGPDRAPNGKYNVEYTIEDKKGNTTTKSYSINLINNQTIKFCEFGNPTLPPGKNVWIRVIVPRGEQLVGTTDKIYVTGTLEVGDPASFQDGDWSGGGNPNFALNKVSATCYQLAVNLAAGAEFKFTLGGWDKEIFDANGNPPSNYKYESGSVFEITAYNFKTKPVVQAVLPQDLPTSAIQSGKITTIIDVNSNNDSEKYYLVKKGATNLTGAIEMSRVVGTNRVAGAVPKEANAEYFIVKGNIAKAGANRYGFNKFFKIDGITNPSSFGGIFGFKTEFTPAAVPTQLYIIGGATPKGWNAGDAIANQQFASAGTNKYQITLQLKANDGYLLFSLANPDIWWQTKIGMGGTNPLAGDLVPDGADFKSPTEVGNYKIEIDFETGTYKLTKQP
ncbi:MAG: hypothetical protein MUE85_13795 [Microscillaceae bacterium]|jgi:hypothetical protein|nr:hypothetical protein [Microscillaceae bacterium]